MIAAKSGSRRVKAREFFKGVYTTVLRPDEVLTGVEFPVRNGTHRSAFMELALRRGDYAIVGVAAVARNTNGALAEVSLAYLGAGETPILARSAMAAAERRPAAPPLSPQRSPTTCSRHPTSTRARRPSCISRAC